MDIARSITEPEDFDIDEYTNRMFRMFNSEHCDIELICDNSITNAIIDKFGIKKAKTYAYDMTSFKLEVEVNVAVNHVSFGRVFGFGGEVRIKEPEDDRGKIKKMVECVIELELLQQCRGWIA